MFVYDETTRLHRNDSGRVLSITQVLTIEGCYKGADFFTAEKCTIGQYAHEATALSDTNMLDETELDDVLRGYLESWKKFCQLTGFVPELIEKPLESKIYGFCTKVDRIGTFIDHKKGTVEIKTGVSEQPADAIQTAGQELAAHENGIEAEIRGAVYLDPAGGIPKWRPHKNYSDRNVFLGMLISAKWKLEKGLI